MTRERIELNQAKEKPSMSATNKLLAAVVISMAATFVSTERVEAGLKEAQARQAQEDKVSQENLQRSEANLQRSEANLQRSEANLQRSEANLQRSEATKKLSEEALSIATRVNDITIVLRSMDPKSKETRKLLDELVELKAKLIANGEARALVEPDFKDAKDYKVYTSMPKGIDEVLAMLHYEPKGPILVSENTVNGKTK